MEGVIAGVACLAARRQFDCSCRVSLSDLEDVVVCCRNLAVEVLKKFSVRRAVWSVVGEGQALGGLLGMVFDSVEDTEERLAWSLVADRVQRGKRSSVDHREH